MFIVVWFWHSGWCLVLYGLSCPLWSSVYEFTSPLRTECGMFVMCCMQCYVCDSCFIVRGYAVSTRYIDVCNCDMFSVVNVYLYHLKFCVVCIINAF